MIEHRVALPFESAGPARATVPAFRLAFRFRLDRPLSVLRSVVVAKLQEQDSNDRRPDQG